MQTSMTPPSTVREDVVIPFDGVHLEGELVVPELARGVVLFAHGSGSSRKSPRNVFVAERLNRDARAATLLVDLLSAEEERIDDVTRRLRFDIPMLAERLLAARAWLASDRRTDALSVGYFGASTGAGTALLAAARNPNVAAVVSRGGRPDLAGPATLSRVEAPTLLIVGGRDELVLDLNFRARRLMRAETALEIIPGATHLFAEPGALERVADKASAWFNRFL